MTIHGILKSLSAKELALTKRYYESIQRFEVQPSDTYEFDAEFPAEDGERIIAEIVGRKRGDRGSVLYLRRWKPVCSPCGNDV